jgi:hypothetical protein
LTSPIKGVALPLSSLHCETCLGSPAPSGDPRTGAPAYRRKATLVLTLLCCGQLSLSLGVLVASLISLALNLRAGITEVGQDHLAGIACLNQGARLTLQGGSPRAGTYLRALCEGSSGGCHSSRSSLCHCGELLDSLRLHGYYK